MKKLAIATALLLLGATFAYADAAPGSEEDPLVTQRYVDSQIEALRDELSQTSSDNLDAAKTYAASLLLDVAESESASPLSTAEGGLKSEVLFLEQGTTLELDEGTLLILRTGKADAIEGTSGGLSDLTKGSNLVNGSDIERDHLIFTPRSDGRGIIMLSEGYVVVSGAHSVHN